jgi:hypothetical protein
MFRQLGRTAKGILWSAAACGFMALAGCIPFIPVYYAYPTVVSVPKAYVGEGHKDVRAFRVVIKDDLSTVDLAKPGSYQLSELRITKDGQVPGQVGVQFDTGFIWNCVALTYESHTNRTARVRLYRPGFDLVELVSGDPPGEVKWEEVKDLLQEEKAIDALLSPTEQSTWNRLHEATQEEPWCFAQLDPGSVSPAHRKALLFAAAEYERLAKGLVLSGAGARCVAKAKWLQDHAKE